MKFNEKTLDKEYLYNGKILSLRKDQVLLPDGNKAVREVVEHSGGSCIVCEMNDKILLVKQFRYPYGKELYELPAGKLNEGESPEQTAIRELEEEGGVIAERVEKMFEVYPTPAYTNEIIRIYRAINVRKSTQHLDDDEFLECCWFDKDTLRELIKKGEIKDAKTLIALLAIL